MNNRIINGFIFVTLYNIVLIAALLANAPELKPCTDTQDRFSMGRTSTNACLYENVETGEMYEVQAEYEVEK